MRDNWRFCDGIASMDMFVVPTISFRLLYGLLIIRLSRRELLWLGVTANSYQQYYNEVRTHLSLQKDAPISPTVRTVGRVLPLPMLGGLHHQYVRV